MNDVIREKLEAQIVRDLEQLENSKQYGSEDRKQMVNDLDKLYRLLLDDLKVECDIADSGDRFIAEQEQREFENDYKKLQTVRDKKDRIIRYILDGAAIGVPALVSVFMILEGFKFEETGTVTSKFFQWIINRQRIQS